MRYIALALLLVVACGGPRPPRPAQRFYQMGVYRQQISFLKGTGYSCKAAIEVRGSNDEEIVSIAIGLWLSTAYPDHEEMTVSTDVAGEPPRRFETHSIRAINGAEFSICFDLTALQL